MKKLAFGLMAAALSFGLAAAPGFAASAPRVSTESQIVQVQQQQQQNQATKKAPAKKQAAKKPASTKKQTAKKPAASTTKKQPAKAA